MNQIFISYKKDDSHKWINNLKNILTQLGCNIWIDEVGLTGGDNWEQRIEEVIDQSTRYILCLSNSWKKDGFAKKELQMILEACASHPDRQIIAIEMEEANLNIDFKDSQPVFIKAYETYGYKNLLESLAEVITNDEMRAFYKFIEPLALHDFVNLRPDNPYGGIFTELEIQKQVTDFFANGERLKRSAHLVADCRYAETLDLWRPVMNNPCFDPSHESWFAGGVSPFLEKLLCAYLDLVRAMAQLIVMQLDEVQPPIEESKHHIKDWLLILVKRMISREPKRAEFALSPCLKEAWKDVLYDVYDRLFSVQEYLKEDIQVLMQSILKRAASIDHASAEKPVDNKDFIQVKAMVKFPSKVFSVSGRVMLERYDPGSKEGFDICWDIDSQHDEDTYSIFRHKKFEVSRMGSYRLVLTRPFMWSKKNEISDLVVPFIRNIDSEFGPKFPESVRFCDHCYHAYLDKEELKEEMNQRLTDGIVEMCTACNKLRLDHKDEKHMDTRSPIEAGEKYNPHVRPFSKAYSSSFYREPTDKTCQLLTNFESELTKISLDHSIHLDTFAKGCEILFVGGKHRLKVSEELTDVKVELNNAFQRSLDD